MRLSYATLREIASGLKRIWESETVSHSPTRIIKDVDRALEVFEILPRAWRRR